MKSPQILLFNYLVLAFVVGPSVSMAQQNIASNNHSGIEVQQYPTGFLFGIHHQKSLGTKHNLELRVGYNLVRHGDAGVHDDERGGGWGGSLGINTVLTRNRSDQFQGLIGSIRTDIWRNVIAWRDHIGQSTETSGQSKVIVLQPTLLLGYRFSLGNIRLVPTLAIGAEINVRVKGSEVGEGAILLWGLRVLHSW